MPTPIHGLAQQDVQAAIIAATMERNSISVTKAHKGQKTHILIPVSDIVSMDGGTLTFIRTSNGIHYVTESLEEIEAQVMSLLNH